MKYCKVKPWYRLKSDMQVTLHYVGWACFMIYGVVTLIIGLAAWDHFFWPGSFPDRPIWVEFIRLSWYFWVPVITLKLLHMLVCEKD